MTPAQLDAIATKLLGWRRLTADAFLSGDVHVGVRERLRPSSRTDAMLVLEAMGRQGFIATLKGWPTGWRCSAGRSAESQGEGKEPISAWENADTPAAAIFQCAARLVERM